MVRSRLLSIFVWLLTLSGAMQASNLTYAQSLPVGWNVLSMPNTTPLRVSYGAGINAGTPICSPIRAPFTNSDVLLTPIHNVPRTSFNFGLTINQPMYAPFTDHRMRVHTHTDDNALRASNDPHAFTSGPQRANIYDDDDDDDWNNDGTGDFDNPGDVDVPRLPIGNGCRVMLLLAAVYTLIIALRQRKYSFLKH